MFALERLLPRVRSHVHLDVALVQKSAIANLTMVHHLLLVTAAPRIRTRATDAAQLGPDPATVLLLDLC